MTASFPIPFGPVLDPDFGLSSWFFVDDFITLDKSTSDGGEDGHSPHVSTTGAVVHLATAVDAIGAVELQSGGTATSDSGLQLQGEPFVFKHDKDLLFAARIKLSALTSNWFVGLHEELPADATGSGSAFDIGGTGSIVADHIGFAAQQDASIDVRAGNGTSQSLKDTTDDLVADTYVILALKYSAVDGKLRYYVDGKLRGNLSRADDNLPVDNTTLTFGAHNEALGAAANLTLDWWYIAGVR